MAGLMGDECAFCVGLLPTSADRTSEGHIAVRFGDRYFTVLLDDFEVAHVFEAIGGADGLVAFYPDPIRRCSAGRDHVFSEVAVGFVQVLSGARA